MRNMIMLFKSKSVTSKKTILILLYLGTVAFSKNGS